MTSWRQSESPQCLVIDTNVLLLILADQCHRSLSTDSLQRVRVLNEIRGRSDDVAPQQFEALRQLFYHAKRRIITTHVVAEAYGLRKRLGTLKYKKDLVWKNAVSLLGDPGIEEMHCSMLDLQVNEAHRKILFELGPCDADVILTAQQQKATALTDDGKLCNWAKQLIVPTLNLHQL